MQAFLLVLHVLMAVTLIALVLIQHGRGADAGAAFGSGASGTVFGSRGSASFLTRATTFLAIGFFANSLALAYLSANQPVSTSLMDRVRIEEPAGASVNIPLGIPAESAASSDAAGDQGAGDVPAVVVGE